MKIEIEPTKNNARFKEVFFLFVYSLLDNIKY